MPKRTACPIATYPFFVLPLPAKTNAMKRLLPDILVIVTFALLSFAYFYPADTEGRILFQHDTEAGAGAGPEALPRTDGRTHPLDQHDVRRNAHVPDFTLV